jgi:hypothetical protein
LVRTLGDRLSQQVFSDASGRDYAVPTISAEDRFMRRALVPTVVLAAVVACVWIATDAAAAPPAGAMQKLAACMKAKGYTGRPTQAQRTNAKYNTAHAACAKQAGLTGTRNTAAKYVSCMKKHGITISATKKPSRTSAAYKKANAACASLRGA